MVLRDCILVLIVVYFYCTSALVVIGIFSRTLIGTDVDEVYCSHGLWQRCYKPSNLAVRPNCSLFDWQNEVKDSVAADRVRSILAFGTMTFLGACVILLSPFVFPIITCGSLSLKAVTYLAIASYIFMGVMGAMTWILLASYFDDIRLDDFTTAQYGWGAYVFMVGVAMTLPSLPILLCCIYHKDREVYPLVSERVEI